MTRGVKNIWGMIGIIFAITGVIASLGFAVRTPFLWWPTIIAGLFVAAGVVLVGWAFSE